MEHFRRLVAVRDQPDVLPAAVQEARAAGLPWSVIGAAVGATPQAAYERFGAPAGPEVA